MMKKLEGVTNKTERTKIINKSVDYNIALELSNNYQHFYGYLMDECTKVFMDATSDIIQYFKSEELSYDDDALYLLLGKLFVRPLYNGYQTEGVKALYLQTKGYKLYMFSSEENRLLFDSEYGIDFIVEIDDRYYGVQSKSGSYLNVGWRDMDFSLRAYHYGKHLKAMQDIHKYEGIELEDIYFMFNDVGNVYNMLIYDSQNSWGTALKKGDCLVSTHDMVKLSQNDYPLVRFQNFKYVDIREDLRAS